MTSVPPPQRPGLPQEPTNPTIGSGEVDITEAERLRQQQPPKLFDVEQWKAQRGVAAEQTQQSVGLMEPPPPQVDVQPLVDVAKRGQAVLNADRFTREQWLREAKQVVADFVMAENQATLMHAAQRGQIQGALGQLVEEQSANARQQRLDLIDQAAQWTNMRSPAHAEDMRGALQPYLTSQDPNEVARAAEIGSYLESRAQVGQQYDTDSADLERLAKEAVAGEAPGFLRGLKGAAGESLYGTFFQTYGSPEERIQAKLLEEVEGRSEKFRAAYEASPHKGKPNRQMIEPETYRSALLQRALDAATKEVRDTGIDLKEGFTERTVRGAAGLVGLPFAGGVFALAKAGGKLATGVKLGKAGLEQAAKGLTVLQKVIPNAMGAGALGGFIYASSYADPSGVGALSTMDAPEDVRNKARHARAIADTITGSLMLPVFAKAQALGKAVTGGKLGVDVLKTVGGQVIKTRQGKGAFLESALGLALGGEALNLSLRGVRSLLEAKGEKGKELEQQLALWNITHPKAAGAIETMLTGDFEEGAIEFLREMGSNMLFFGTAQLKGTFARHLLRKSDIDRARPEVENLVEQIKAAGGDGEAVKAELDAQLAELEKIAREDTNVEKLTDQAGETVTRQVVDAEARRREADRVIDAVGKRTGAFDKETVAAEQQPRLFDTRETRATYDESWDRLSESRTVRREVDAERRIEAIREKNPTAADALQDFLAAQRDLADAIGRGDQRRVADLYEAAREARRAALDAADGVVRSASDQAAARRDVLQDAMDEPQLREEAAQAILEGRPADTAEFVERARALDDEVRTTDLDLTNRQEAAAAVEQVQQLPPEQALAAALEQAPAAASRQARRRALAERAAAMRKAEIKPDDVVRTERGTLDIEKVEGDLVTARDESGEVVVRTRSELVQEGASLEAAGRPKGIKATKAERKSANKEAKSARVKAHEDRIAELLGKAARTTDKEAKRKLQREAAENLADLDSVIVEEASAARAENAERVDTPAPGAEALTDQALSLARTMESLVQDGTFDALSGDMKGEAPDGLSPLGKSIYATAQRRQGIYAKSGIKGRAKAAQAVYDHMRIADGMEAGESLVAEAARILDRVEQIEAMPEAMQPHHLLRLLDDTKHVLGDYSPLYRMFSEGVVMLQGLERSIPKVDAWMRKDMVGSAMSAGLTPAASAKAMQVIKGLRHLWPWSTNNGWSPHAYAMSSADIVKFAQNVMREYIKAPPTKESEFLSFDKTLLEAGFNLGPAEARNGYIGWEMAHVYQTIATETHTYLQRMLPMLEKLSLTERVEFWEALDSGSWRKEADPVKKAKIQELNDISTDFRDRLWKVSKENRDFTERIALAEQFVARAQAGVAAAKPKSVGLRKKALARAEANLQMLRDDHARAEKAWARENFVHHVRTATLWQGKPHTIKKRRKDAVSPDAPPVVKDVVVSFADYAVNAVALIHRDGFLSNKHEFFYGKLRPAELKDLGERKRVLVDGVREMESLGTVWVYKKSITKNGKTYEREYVAPTRRKVDGVWQNVEAPVQGATRRLLLAPPISDPSKGEVRPKPQKASEVMRARNLGRAGTELMSVSDALLQLGVRDGGWMDQATEARQIQMKDQIHKFKTGAERMQLDVNSAGKVVSGIMSVVSKPMEWAAKFGVLSSKMKMTGVSTPGNILMGAMMMNACYLPPQAHSRAVRWAAQWAKRALTSSTDEQIVPGAEIGSAEWERGRAHMRTPKEMLDKMSPTAKARQSILDDAYVDMATSGLFEHTMLDLDRKARMEPGTLLSVRKIRKALGRGLWDYALGGVRAADTAGRAHLFLGLYVAARESGKSRKEAFTLGAQASAHAHGVFNAMTANPLLTSNVGKFALGLQSYVSRQFFIWLQAPVEFKARYATIALATNYAFQQMGLGDLTNVFGFSLYDLPFVGEPAEEAILGGEEPLGPDGWAATGMIPFHFPLPFTPVIQAIGEGVKGLKFISQMNTQDAIWSVIKAASTALRPALLDSLNRAGFTEGLPIIGDKNERTPDGQALVVSVDEKTRDGVRTSYKLPNQGIVQLMADAFPGTQMPIWEQGMQRRMNEARGRRIEGEKESLKTEFRGAVRRYDVARERGNVTDEDRARFQETIRELGKRGATMGTDLRSQGGLDQAFKEARKENQVARLPPHLRSIAQQSTKEAQVRLLADNLHSIPRHELDVLRVALAGKKHLFDWADDEKHVSREAYEKLASAVRAWRSSPLGRAQSTPATPR